MSPEINMHTIVLINLNMLTIITICYNIKNSAFYPQSIFTGTNSKYLPKQLYQPTVLMEMQCDMDEIETEFLNIISLSFVIRSFTRI
jgi:hypothetical protein